MADLGIITNWTSLTNVVIAPGASMSCHVPHRNFVETLPLNMTIIFQADPTTILCNHNLKPTDLKAAARSAELFPKVFKLPTE